MDEFECKFQIVKHSWKGKYDRIFCMSTSRFCTMDPKHFGVTNSWSWQTLICVERLSDEMIYLKMIQGKKVKELKMKCKYAQYLLEKLYEIRSSIQHSKVLLGQQLSSVSLEDEDKNNVMDMYTSFEDRLLPISYNCSKLGRKKKRFECILGLTPYGVLYKSESGGRVLAVYYYTNVEFVVKVADAVDGIVLGYGGGCKVFFTKTRDALYTKLLDGMKDLGIVKRDGVGKCLQEYVEMKNQFGQDLMNRKSLMAFSITRLGCRLDSERVLELYDNGMVERDRKHAIAITNWKEVYALVRSDRDSAEIIVEYVHERQVVLQCDQRDDLLVAMYDLCVQNGNTKVSLNGMETIDGLRLLPRFAQEDEEESNRFFGDGSIATCFLKRIAALGKYAPGGESARNGQVAGRGMIQMIHEFNSNVDITGIQKHTKKTYVLEAVRPLAALLWSVAQTKAKELTIAVLQALCRIAPTEIAAKEMVYMHGIQNGIQALLQASDILVLFWTLKLVKLLLESTENRQILLKKHCVQLVQLFDVKNPLVTLKVVDILEMVICSGRKNTPHTDYHFAVNIAAEQYDVLLGLLLYSKCASIVLGCTRLLHAILAESEPSHVETIKNSALREGLVMHHVFKAIFHDSTDQRQISRYLVALWIHRHSPALELIERIFPPGLIRTLHEDQVCIELPKVLPDGQIVYDDETKSMAALSSAESTESVDIVQNEGRGFVGSVLALTQMDNTPNLDVFFANVAMDHCRVELKWNSETRAELYTALKCEIEKLNCRNWNHLEFFVNYPSLKDDIIVDGYHVELLDAGLAGVLDRTNLFAQLYQLLLKNLSVEKLAMLCVQCMTIVYDEKHPFLDTLFIEHLMLESNGTAMFAPFLNLMAKLVLNKENARSLINRGSLSYFVQFLDKTAALAEPSILILLQCVKTFYTQDALTPIPRAIQQLASRSSLHAIVRAILSEDISANASILLNLMCAVNFEARSYLFESGFFYFIFITAESNFEVLVNALYATHEIQSTGVEKSSTWHSSKIQYSVLCRMLPEALIRVLRLQGAEKFHDVYFEDIDSHEIIWNKKMREYLISMIHEHLGEMNDDYVYRPIAPVVYKEMVGDLYCDGVHLRKWCEESFLVPNATSFLTQLLAIEDEQITIIEDEAQNLLSDNVRTSYQRDSDIDFETLEMAYFAMTTGAYNSLVDGRNYAKLALICRSQICVYQRFESQLVDFKYDKYDSLISLLQLCNKFESTSASTSLEDCKRLELTMELVSLATQLMYLSCLCNPTNGAEIIKLNGLSALIALFEFCVQNKGYTEVLTFTVQLLTGLAAMEDAMQHFCNNISSLKCVCSVLDEPMPNCKIAQFSLELVSRMCENAELKKQLLDAGIVLYLIDINIRSLDCPLDTKENIQCLATRALGRLGSYLEGALKSPKVSSAKTMISALLTPSVANCLSTSSCIADILLNEIEDNPILFWNSDMRDQLSKFIQAEKSILASSDAPLSYDSTRVLSFQYDALKEKFIIDSVYVDILIAKLCELDDECVDTSVLPEEFYVNLVQLVKSSDCEPQFDSLSSESNSNLDKHFEKAMLVLSLLSHLNYAVVAAVLQELKCSFVFIFQAKKQNKEYFRVCIFAIEILENLRNDKKFVIWYANILPALVEHLYLHKAIQDVQEEMVLQRLFKVIASYCENSTAAEVLVETRCVIELFAWFLQIDDAVSDRDYKFAESCRLLAIRIIVNAYKSSLDNSLILGKLFSLIFPIGLRDMILDDVDQAVVHYDSDFRSAELIWNSQTRNQIWSYMNHALASIRNFNDFKHPWRDLDSFRHPNLYKQEAPVLLCVGGVYLQLWIEDIGVTLRYPEYVLKNCLTLALEYCQQNLQLSKSPSDSFNVDDPFSQHEREENFALIVSCVVCLVLREPTLHLEVDTFEENATMTGKLLEKCIQGSDIQLNLLRILNVMCRSDSGMRGLTNGNVLTNLMASTKVRGLWHPEVAFVFDCTYWYVSNYNRNIDSSTGIVSYAIECNVLRALLTFLDGSPQDIRGVRHPLAARALAISILKFLEADSKEGYAAHQILKRHREWDKVYKLQNISGVVLQWENTEFDFYLSRHSHDAFHKLKALQKNAPQETRQFESRDSMSDDTQDGRQRRPSSVRRLFSRQK